MKQSSYNTKQKSAIMKCIKFKGDKHFTIDEICDTLLKMGEAVGRTTVYRMLEKLADEGVLCKYTMPSGESTCYQYIDKHTHCREHFHLKCEKCGSLIHMDCDEMNSLAQHIESQHGFKLDPLKTVIYGICEGCNAQ